MDVALGVIGTAGIALHAARRVCEFISSIRGAPRAVESLGSDIHALSEILETLQTMLQSFELRSKNRQQRVILKLQEPLENCIDTLRDVEIKIMPHVKQHKKGQHKRNMSSTWRDFMWTFKEKDVLALQSTLTSHKQTLDIAISVADFSSSRSDFHSVKHKIHGLQRKLNEDRQSIYNSTYAGSEAEGSDYQYNMRRWLRDADTTLDDIASIQASDDEILERYPEAESENQDDLEANAPNEASTATGISILMGHTVEAQDSHLARASHESLQGPVQAEISTMAHPLKKFLDSQEQMNVSGPFSARGASDTNLLPTSPQSNPTSDAHKHIAAQSLTSAYGFLSSASGAMQPWWIELGQKMYGANTHGIPSIELRIEDDYATSSVHVDRQSDKFVVEEVMSSTSSNDQQDQSKSSFRRRFSFEASEDGDTVIANDSNSGESDDIPLYQGDEASNESLSLIEKHAIIELYHGRQDVPIAPMYRAYLAHLKDSRMPDIETSYLDERLNNQYETIRFDIKVSKCINMAHELRRCWSEMPRKSPIGLESQPIKLDDIYQYRTLFHVSLFATHNIFPWNLRFRPTTVKQRLPVDAIINMTASFWPNLGEARDNKSKAIIGLVDPKEPELGLDIHEFVVWAHVNVNWFWADLPTALPTQFHGFISRGRAVECNHYDGIPVEVDGYCEGVGSLLRRSFYISAI